MDWQPGDSHDPEFVSGDRVCMIGVDLHGTVTDPGFLGPVRVAWDRWTPEEGLSSWADPEHLILTKSAVAGRR